MSGRNNSNDIFAVEFSDTLSNWGGDTPNVVVHHCLRGLEKATNRVRDHNGLSLRWKLRDTRANVAIFPVIWVLLTLDEGTRITLAKQSVDSWRLLSSACLQNKYNAWQGNEE